MPKVFFSFQILNNITAKLPRYVRINTLITSIDEVLNAFYNDGWNLLPRCTNYSQHLEVILNLEPENFIQDFHIPEVLVFPPGTKFHNHPGYLNGKLLLQDKASCLTAFLLNPKPGSEIMDMCAAPGMKTTHLAAVINNTGKIYAIEMNERRFTTLCDFVSLAKASSVETIKADVLSLRSELYPEVKYIVVDPSCSGSGMERFEIKKSDEMALYSRLQKLHDLQSTILNHALRHFPNVKKVIYSTCSIYREENESVVQEALEINKKNFKLVNLKKKLKNEWHNFGSSEYGFDGNKCLYAYPETDICKGFFVAMFKRKSKLAERDVQEIIEDSREDIYQQQTTNNVENNKASSKSDVQNNSSKTKKRKTNFIAQNEEKINSQNEIDTNIEVPLKKIKK